MAAAAAGGRDFHVAVVRLQRLNGRGPRGDYFTPSFPFVLKQQQQNVLCICLVSKKGEGKHESFETDSQFKSSKSGGKHVEK